MVENILSLVKDQVVKSIAGKVDIPSDKKQQAIDTTASSVLDGLKQQASAGDITDIISMFSDKSGSSLINSWLSKGVESTVVAALTSKVGLNKSTATTLAGVVVPAVLNMFLKKANDNSDSSFDVGSLIGMLTGGSSSGGSSDTVSKVIGALGGLLGKK